MMMHRTPNVRLLLERVVLLRHQRSQAGSMREFRAWEIADTEEEGRPETDRHTDSPNPVDEAAKKLRRTVDDDYVKSAKDL